MEIEQNKEEQLQLAVKQVESAGVTEKTHKIERLLLKTNGNVQVVVTYLLAKQKLAEVTKANKHANREPRRHKRGQEEHKEDRGGRQKRRDVIPAEKIESEPGIDENQLVYDLNAMESWPKGAQVLFLDGNNMLFVLSSLRAMTLKREQRKNAESLLASLALMFTNRQNLKHCSVVYDTTSLRHETHNLSVSGARPTYSTTDDAFAEWAGQLKEPTVFVTSDRELIQRLKENGGDLAIVCKPKSWFRFVALTVSGWNGSLDEWFDKLLKEGLLSVLS